VAEAERRLADARQTALKRPRSYAILPYEGPNQTRRRPIYIECLAEEIIPGGVERNRESSAKNVIADDGLPPLGLEIFFDPQTSGGLLIALTAPAAEGLLARLREADCPEAAVIGRVLGPGTGRISVRYQGRRSLPLLPFAPRKSQESPAPQTSQVSPSAARASATFAERKATLHEPQETNTMDCCAGGHDTEKDGTAAAAGTSAVQQKFQEFLKSAAAPGALDGQTKRAIAIALSVLAKCEPCLRIHIKKAQDEGFTEVQIDEAAWMAISFGGSPTMMFYQGVRK
jgi:AhpD family alkylhydroperoxidase